MANEPSGILSDIAGYMATIASVCTSSFFAFLAFRKKREEIAGDETEAPVARSTHHVQQDINESFATSIERLERQLADAEAERDAERKSGLEHYQRTLRMYRLLNDWLVKWRRGDPAPDCLMRMEDL